MRALVVVAHPNPEAFTHAVARRVESGLNAAGHETTVLDLGAIRFRAAMTRQEREAYHGDEPVVDPVVARHADAVRDAGLLVFVYPTWWGGLPAVLKGWLDRVLVPGVAFVFDDRSGKVRPGLGHVRRIVGVTTYGSPRPYVRVMTDAGRRVLTRSLRMSCGWRTRTEWHALYAIDTSTAEERCEFLTRVERRMAEL